LAIVHPTAPNVSIYKNDNGVLTKLTVPTSDIGGSSADNYGGIAWSPDSQHCAMIGYRGALTIYKMNGNTPEKMSLVGNPLVGTYGADLAWSSDGNYIFAGYQNTTRYYAVKVLNITSTTVTLSNLSMPTIPSENVLFSACDISPDVSHLCVGGYTTAANILKRSGDTFSILSSPFNVTPGVQIWGIRYSPNGSYVAMHSDVGGFSVYKRNGDFYTRVFHDQIANTSRGSITWDDDSNYVAISHIHSPYFHLYKRTEDVFTDLPQAGASLDGHGSSISF